MKAILAAVGRPYPLPRLTAFAPVAWKGHGVLVTTAQWRPEVLLDGAANEARKAFDG